MKTIMLKKDASMLTGGLTQTSKMPCKSLSASDRGVQDRF